MASGRPSGTTREAQRLAFIQCKTYGHAWEEFIPFGKRDAPWGKRISIRCVRCESERHDLIDSRGELSARHYDYNPAYRDEFPAGVYDKADYRKLLKKEGKALNADVA